jgi:hypothetical protein
LIPKYWKMFNSRDVVLFLASAGKKENIFETKRETMKKVLKSFYL